MSKTKKENYLTSLKPKKFLATLISLAILFSITVLPVSNNISEILGLQITASAAISGDFNCSVGGSSGDNFITITGYTGNSTILNIPSYLDVDGNTYPVKHLGLPTGYGISGVKNITQITMPNTVLSIGPYAFQNCNQLSSVTFSPNIQNISNYAFKGCVNLTSINLYNLTSLTSVGTGAFENCYSLSYARFASSLNSIGGSAFKNCYALTNIQIPSTCNLVQINSSAFENCSSLSSFSIPTNVTNISSGAFKNCSSLRTLTLANTNSKLNLIGSYAFYGCSSLENLTFPGNANTNLEVEEYAFSECTSLNTISILKRKNINFRPNTFKNCTQLTTVNYPQKQQADDLDGIAFGKDTFLNTPYYSTHCTSGVYPGMSDLGSAKNCTGKQLVVSVFLNATINGTNQEWSNTEKQSKNQQALYATQYIYNQGTRYNNYTNFVTAATDSGLEMTIPNNNISITVPDNNVIQRVTVNGVSMTTSSFLNQQLSQNMMSPNNLKSAYAAQGVVYIVFIEYDGRSCAFCYDPGLDSVNIIRTHFSDSDDTSRSIAHELLHAYGAPDVYSDSNSSLNTYSSIRYQKDIMRIVSPLSSLNLNSYAAYCIGWTNFVLQEDANVYNFT